MRRRTIKAVLAGAVVLGSAAALGSTEAWAYDLTIPGGSVHGPGSMPDTPLPPGRFTHLVLDDRLDGVTAFFNNGSEPPNIPGEKEIFGRNEGKLSTGVPFNEHVDGGVVSIGQGALKMLAVIAGDGELKGQETYRLDDRLNWVLRTDLALDPGFPQGLVVSRDITITTGVLPVAQSLQSQGGLTGGVDQAGSYPSGAPVYGRLGDLDGDGYLDGRIVGVGRVPLGFMFVPGAPLVQVREFTSDIPVTPEEAGLLTFASLANLANILAVADDASPAGRQARAYVLAHAKAYLDDFTTRARSAHALLSAAGPGRSALARQAADIEALLTRESGAAQTWAAAGAVPEASAAPIQDLLRQVNQAIPALRADLHFTQIGR